MRRRTAEERLLSVKTEIEQLKNQEKLLANQIKENERKARTKRLIERGAILESLIEGAAELTNDQITEILKETVGSPYGKKTIAKAKSKTEEPITIPQGETPAQNDDAAAIESEETDEGGGNISAHGAENAETKGL